MSPTQVKICGISTPDALAATVKAGASHVGFVHFPKSPRHLSLEQAASLRARVPSHVKSVLLVVDLPPALLAEAIDAVRPDVVQFHGSESPEFIAEARRTHAVEAWKAIGVKEPASLARALEYRHAVDMVLYDAPARALPGGNGLALDWSLLAGYRHAMPWGLAGGLTPANVAEAIRQTGAPLVDTSSGVEREPGVKDSDKIAAFCQAAHHHD